MADTALKINLLKNTMQLFKISIRKVSLTFTFLFIIAATSIISGCGCGLTTGVDENSSLNPSESANDGLDSGTNMVANRTASMTANVTGNLLPIQIRLHALALNTEGSANEFLFNLSPNAEGGVAVVDPNQNIEFHGVVLWAADYLHDIDSAKIAKSIKKAMSTLDSDETEKHDKHHKHHANDVEEVVKTIAKAVSKLDLDEEALSQNLEAVVSTLATTGEATTIAAAVQDFSDSLAEVNSKFNQAALIYGIGRPGEVPPGHDGLGSPNGWTCVNRFLLLTLTTSKGRGAYFDTQLKSGDKLYYFIAEGDCGTYSCSGLSRN